MIILGIETSCDETGAAVVEGEPNGKTVTLISNILASSQTIHAKTGGIIPEIAARQQVKYIIPAIEQALKEGGREIDAIAVTVGPGLIGSLLVGVETARTLAYVWNKPIVPVNHLIGHIYANFVRKGEELDAIEFPAIALVVSGGHTDLVLIRNHGKIRWLGGTRDDAAGETLDKIGRVLGLPYPGGPAIEMAAKNGNPKAFIFPRPMLDSHDFDFSFSGLKTAVLREVRTIKRFNPLRSEASNETIVNISASVQQAVIDVLVSKTIRAAQRFNVRSILLSGGVAANQKLREQFELGIRNQELGIELFAPPKSLCTDNAVMIASAAFFNYAPIPWQKISANPELYFDTIVVM